jgi:hypothetical protein
MLRAYGAGPGAFGLGLGSSATGGKTKTATQLADDKLERLRRQALAAAGGPVAEAVAALEAEGGGEGALLAPPVPLPPRTTTVSFSQVLQNVLDTPLADAVHDAFSDVKNKCKCEGVAAAGVPAGGKAKAATAGAKAAGAPKA